MNNFEDKLAELFNYLEHQEDIKGSNKVEKIIKLLDVLKFHINNKANIAAKNIDNDYHKGQYMAFNEIYSLLCNLK